MQVLKKWLTPELMAVLFSCSLAFFAGGMLYPVLPLYLQGEGMSPGTIGMIFLVMTLATAISELSWGWLIDRIDLRIAIVIGTSVLGLVTLGFQYASTTEAFFLAGFLFGFFRSPLYVIGRWYVGVNAPRAMKTVAMASLGTIFSIAQSAAGFTTGFVTDAYGYSAVVWVAAALPFAAGLILLLASPWLDFRRRDLAEAPIPADGPASGGRGGSSLWTAFWLGLVANAYFVTVGIVLTYLPLFTTDVVGADVRQVGILFGIQGFVYAVAMPPIGRLADRLGKKRFLPAGLTLVVISMAGVALSKSYGALVVCIILYAVGSSMYEPAGVAVLSERMAPERQGTAIGIYALLEDVGWMIGPALGGVLWGMSGPQAPFLLSALAAAIGMGLSLWIVRAFLGKE